MKRYCAFRPGELWLDDNGIPINAHGGGILRHGGCFYWYGEHKIGGREGNRAHVGVHVYESEDLYNWCDRGIALDIRDGRIPELPPGCVIERPKVLEAAATGRFVMYFHFESGAGYRDAATGIAVAERPEGPFRLLRIARPNPGVWPLNTPEWMRSPALIDETRRVMDCVHCGRDERTKSLSILGACLPEGQESRDMTLFLDDDGRGWHVYSSEHNSTVHLAELSGDFESWSGRYRRILPFRWTEGIALFKRRGRYWMIGSGCTGWKPNPGRSAVAASLDGPWEELGNPAVDEGGDTTYGGQSTFVLKLDEDHFILMLDLWRPENAIDGRYLWLPVRFDGARPVVHAPEEWSLEQYLSK